MKKITTLLIGLFSTASVVAQISSGGYCSSTTNFYNQTCFTPWTTNDLIDNFWTTGGTTDISNLLSGCTTNALDNYSDFTSLVLTTVPGATIGLNVQGAVNGSTGPCLQGSGGCFQQGFAVFIDWNQDLDFNDPGEKVYESPGTGHQVFSGSFTVPVGACGDYRMRVRCAFATPGANITACGTFSYGEIEDYTISVGCTGERTICEGETATIDYSIKLPPTSPITVVVSPMTNVNIAIPNISFNPLDTTIYLVTWTSPDSSWQDTAKIYVNDPLLPTYAGENDTICTGNLVQLQATLGNTNTNYQWFLGYPSTNIGAIYIPNPNVLNPNIISNNPGSVYAIFTETDTLNVCPAVSDTATIIFSSEFHNVVKVDPTCNGYTDGQIIINSTGTLGAVEYSIDNGGTWGTSNTYTGLSAGTYDIISKDVAGCTYASSITLVDPAIVTISTVNDTTVCENGTATLTAASTNGSFFNWNFTPSLSANQSINPINDSTITVFATNFAGCSSDTLTVEVTMYDPITVSITENDTICPGNPTTLVATATGGHMGFDYGWQANGSTTSWATSVLNLAPNQETTYCVSVTDGCESTPKSICTKIVMRDVPTTEFITTVIEQCVPAVANFEVITPDYLFSKAFISVGGKQYVLNNNGTGNNSVTHTFNSVGTFDFYLRVTSPYGCVNDTTAYQEVTSYPIPEPDFYLSPEEATIFQPTFEIVNLTDGANNNYTWFMPGGEPTSSNAQNPTVVYPEGEASNYPIQLTVVSPQGCRDSVTNFAKVVNDIVIYAPNSFTPNDDAYNDNWRIYIAGIDVYEFHLRIYNRWGEIVFESFDPEATWDGRLVSGRLVDPGTYVWLIEAKDISSSETIDFRGTVNVFK